MMNARQFTWTDNVGVAEMSDLGNADMRITQFEVLSSKTQTTKRFVYSHAKYVGEGEDREIGSWIYKSADGLEIHILND